jgi:predicted nucleic acid-binding Zn ribbon protein
LTAVGGTLAGLLDGLGLSATLKGWEAISVWSETVGAPANERSRAVAFDAGRLIVEVESSAWMTQLSFLKRDIKANNRRLAATSSEHSVRAPRFGRTHPENT